MQNGGDAMKLRGFRKGALRILLLTWACSLAPVAVARLAAQQVLTQSSRTITIARGGSALVQALDQVQRLSIADPAIADATAISTREVLVNGKTAGTTTLLLWDRNDRVNMMSVVVTPDIGALQRQIETLFPGVPVTLSASGSAIIVSGNVRDPHVARRIIDIVTTSGGTVIDNMAAPAARQVLLHVRFAEVERSALSRLNADLRSLNPQNLGSAFKDINLLDVETLSEGIVRLFLMGDNGSTLETLIRALKTQGYFRSLAEPNLVAIEGQEAKFLAGGEFPFPMVQSNAGTNAITIAWKEFGVRLNFTPFVTNTGSIRLKVMPEVSSLDFANGLTFGGFQVPAMLTRRAETSVELRPGQNLGIAGLLDNSKLVEKTKIPLLGDLPIIGTFFKSTSARDRKTELLVVVTPHLVEPMDTVPTLPSGDPAKWDRNGFMREGTLKLPAGVQIVPPAPNGNK